ncbi:small GTP-binding protein [Tritrichomonas foetus]|uniref:Small GTP-binding protein n=1 Tax=Tritrichomonas foetus TaxID=1144522 RepID=A0A1J4KRR4_9EUKA|nr:small GTP-binding protein [Tritrichomonas foetus]|eukprot:OHT13786.1 small GTP-binding protein [Tritrichomonas foetus]
MEESEVKVVLLGQSAVGKTCIVSHLISGKFDDSASPTLGASYASKTLDIDNTKVSLQIWDTAGQERFRVLAPMYYRGAQAAILVYSIIDEATFTEIDYWSNSLKENAGNNVALFLVGNKCDLEKERAISEDSGQAKATSIGAQFFETSAMTGSGIEDLFLTLAKKCLESTSSLSNGAQGSGTTSETSKPQTVDVSKKSAKSKKECC